MTSSTASLCTALVRRQSLANTAASLRRARATAVDAAMAPTATRRCLRHDWGDDGNQRVGQRREYSWLQFFAIAVDAAHEYDYLNSEDSCS